MRAEQIIRNVRAAMKAGQHVLLCEMQRPERVSQHPLFSLDLTMMLIALAAPLSVLGPPHPGRFHHAPLAHALSDLGQAGRLVM